MTRVAGTKASVKVLFFSLCLVLSLVSLFSCSSGRKMPLLSENHRLAIELNNRGDRAYRSAEYGAAIESYRKAFDLSRSLDDTDSIALNALNLAASYRKTGDHENTLKYCDFLLMAKGYRYESHHLARASYLKALVLIDGNKPEEAARLIDGGLDYCKKGSCRIKGAFYNLQAKAALRQNDYDTAKVLALEALKINTNEGDLQERANSFRLVAHAMLELGEAEGAGKAYEEALSIDKKLGLSEKIALDLEGMGRSYFKLRACDRARDYLERAISVREGMKKREAATAPLREMVGRCDEKQNEE